MIRLSAGDWATDVLPDLGGSIGRLDWRGQAVFRAASEAASDPLESGCFPLVPYANRIDHGRFQWGGREIDVGPTPGFEPHALHGRGWREAWTVLEQDEACVRIGLRVAAGRWPWAWSAEQRISLDQEGLSIDVSLTNESSAPMPGGLGLHPYFATRPGHRIRLFASSVWVGETLIPDRLVPVLEGLDWGAGIARGDVPFVDNAYEGWSGIAQIASADRTVTLASAASRLHVYAPVGEPFICLEPVTHRPNALNAPKGEVSGLSMIAPGETIFTGLSVTAELISSSDCLAADRSGR